MKINKRNKLRKCTYRVSTMSYTGHYPVEVPGDVEYDGFIHGYEGGRFIIETKDGEFLSLPITCVKASDVRDEKIQGIIND